MDARSAEPGLTSSGWSLSCRLAAHACLRAGRAEIAELRRCPGAAAGLTFPPSVLKHSDEQTIVGLAVILRAMARSQNSFSNDREWGVVAAPAMFGRNAWLGAASRFMAEGAWGVRPHSIPHGTLHAASGTISQALQIRGPNLSIGGGDSAAREGMLVAASLLSEGGLPGLWLVLTGYEREKMPDATEDIACLGVALGLTLRAGQEGSASSPTWRIHVRHDTSPAAQEFTLASHHAALSREPIVSGSWRLPGVGWVEVF